MNRFAALALTLLAPTLATTSVASAEVEVSGIAGLHVFSETNGLGVPDEDDANSLKNSALFGFRIGAYFGHLGVEAEAGVIPTEPRKLVFDVYSLAYRGNVVYQFRDELASNKVIPFALAGAGQIRVIDTANEQEIMKEAILALHAGGGVKYRAQNDWGVRLDVRGLFVPASTGSNTFDAEVLLSIYKEFGRKKGAEAPKAPPPKTDDDPDKDGILGALDRCANEPEDKDAFQDDDGCPDADNDADGLADAADKCPIEPEDKDSFMDDDGCPDPDNDGDGVLDAADKCNGDPETRNGFQDDDGCPDEVPEQIKKFTGVIQGIQFKVNSADLVPGSTKVLDKAVAVLAEFKDVKLEIQGHTDDQPLKNTKTFADNTALSQARAETVKAYFVSKGIEEPRVIAKGYGDTAPVASPEGLKGGKLNAARAKNRRVEFKLVTEEPATAPTPPTPPTSETPPSSDTPPPAPTPSTPEAAPATPAPAPAPKQ